ncbi:MAG TPA: MBL fold metallo-hydrolase [Xanthobacteraceae bacterium]|nr:MBL fold metallo-hydrolase [Xanthobacteraceae bacterium]
MRTFQTSSSRGAGSPDVAGFYELDTGSIQYVVSDPASRRAMIVDPVLNYDPKAGRTGTRSADEILRHVEQAGLSVDWVIDTHPHADHFSAGAYLKDKLGTRLATGEKVRDIAVVWRKLYNMPDAFEPSTFDRVFADGESFDLGTLPVRVMLSPGHTLASITLIVGEDAALVHDTLMQPDSGTSRADFPGADVATLYRSIKSILALPGTTRLFVGHDYCHDGREPAWESTVAEQKASNVHVKDGVGEAEFVRIRSERDRTLPLPDRMLHALQVNLRAGRLPEPESDGHRYLRIPLNRF